MADHKRTDGTRPDAVVYETYLEAHQEARRRGAGDAASGLVARVVKSPYGGYMIRSWPVDLLADPELRHMIARNDRPVYADL